MFGLSSDWRFIVRSASSATSRSPDSYRAADSSLAKAPLAIGIGHAAQPLRSSASVSGASRQAIGSSARAIGHDAPAIRSGTSRPTIGVEAQRARVKITGKKPGFDSVNIYSRKKGDVAWKLIAVRKRKFPYYDESPLAVAETPEVREYMAIGVINDEEIGEMSEIKEVVYAG